MIMMRYARATLYVARGGVLAGTSPTAASTPLGVLQRVRAAWVPGRFEQVLIAKLSA